MVYHQARKRKTRVARFFGFLGKMLGILLLAGFIAVFFTSLIIVSVQKIQGSNISANQNTGPIKDSNGNLIRVDGIDTELAIFNDDDDDELDADEPEPVREVDFQAAVENWIKKAGGNAGVYIYDLDTDKVVANYRGDDRFSTASLYKLFVVYEGYRRLESGEWKEDTKVGGTGKTILQCLDLAVRESHSPCAESLHSMIGYDNMAEIIKNDFGLENTSARYLYSTPEEIAKMMKIFYEHKDITNANYLVQIKDSFLNQPKTTYDWRRGLPKGFSDKVDVYNKVGWEFVPDDNYWKIYDDAAIVEFKDEGRKFIVVEMTSRVALNRIVELGTIIENTFYNN